MVTTRTHYSLKVFDDAEREAGNVDVEVRLENGDRYLATFFTIRNIEELFQKNEHTGECLGGLYLWAAHMILVRRISRGVIARTIQDLLARGEFEKVFDGPYREAH